MFIINNKNKLRIFWIKINNMFYYFFPINFYKIFGYRGGGLEGFVPGSEKSKQATAYRLKQTVEAQERQ